MVKFVTTLERGIDSTDLLRHLENEWSQLTGTIGAQGLQWLQTSSARRHTAVGVAYHPVSKQIALAHTVRFVGEHGKWSLMFDHGNCVRPHQERAPTDLVSRLTATLIIAGALHWWKNGTPVPVNIDGLAETVARKEYEPLIARGSFRPIPYSDGKSMTGHLDVAQLAAWLGATEFE